MLFGGYMRDNEKVLSEERKGDLYNIARVAMYFAYDTEKEKYAVGYFSRLQFGVKELVYPDKDSYLTRFESIEAKKEYYASNFDPVNMSTLKYPVEILKLRNLAYDNETIIFKKDFSERLKKWQQESEEIFKTSISS